MTEIHFRSAIELADLVGRKEISSLELTDHFIERIERLDGEINAVVVRDFDRARQAARQADQALASGETRGPLHGIPMTIKESYNIADLPTTFGLPAFRDNVAGSDADAVKKFKAAGAHFLGKTNVPAMLDDFQSYNEIYGTTGNPWDTTRTCGGSSGGSAASLAAGFSGLDAGSDIGGSIRNPAHYCGVFGHKPTWGVVTSEGHSLRERAPINDLSVCGPMARSAEDLALAFSLMQGPHSLNAPGWSLSLPEPRHQSLANFRVAVWADDENAPVEPEIADRVASLGERLAKLGAQVSDTARPEIDPKQSHIDYQSLLHSLMAAGVPPERYRRNQEYAARFDADDFSHLAVLSRAMVLSHADWLRHNARREHARYAWRDFFDQWDILLCPQMASTAFPHDHRKFSERTIQINGETQWYFRQVFWSGLITSPLLPSTIYPTGPSDDGLPIGVQCVTAAYHDNTSIEFVRLLSREFGGFVAPPGLG